MLTGCKVVVHNTSACRQGASRHVARIAMLQFPERRARTLVIGASCGPTPRASPRAQRRAPGADLCRQPTSARPRRRQAPYGDLHHGPLERPRVLLEDAGGRSGGATGRSLSASAAYRHKRVATRACHARRLNTDARRSVDVRAVGRALVPKGFRTWRPQVLRCASATCCYPLLVRGQVAEAQGGVRHGWALSSMR